MQILVRCDRPSLLASRVFDARPRGRGRIARRRPGAAGAHARRRRFYLLLNRVVLADGLGRRGGGAGRRRRQLGLPVPDRLERRKVVSDLSEVTATSRGDPRPRRPSLGALVAPDPGHHPARLAQGLPAVLRPAPAGARPGLHPGAADDVPGAVHDPGRRRRRDPVLRRDLPGVHPAHRDLPRLRRRSSAT